MDKLNEKLISIERALGGSSEKPKDLGQHLEYIEKLIKEGGGGEGAVEDVQVNGVSVLNNKTAEINLKTINNEAVAGTGNIQVNTFKAFDSSWDTTHTIANFCASVIADNNAIEGNAFMGEVVLSDFPSVSLNNADIVVEVISGTTASDKVLHVTMTSGSVSPYRWEYTYWTISDVVHNSGWIPFSQVSGTVSGSNWSTLTINGVTKNIPSGGGGGGSGTQLYEHKILLDIHDLYNDTYEYRLAKVISWENNSFASYQWRDLCGQYIMFFIDQGEYDSENPEYYSLVPICALTNDQEPTIKYYGNMDTFITIEPNYGGSESIVSDTVTPL